MILEYLGFGLDLNLTVNSDMDTIVRAMAEPDSGLDIRDRIWLKIPIPRSFLGSLVRRRKELWDESMYV